MYDLSFFRSNLDAIAKRLGDRGFVLDVESFRKLDSERRAAVTESEQLKAQRNAESQEIAKLRKAGTDTSAQQQAVREMGDRIAALDQPGGGTRRVVPADDGGGSEYPARIGSPRQEFGR